MKYGRWLKQPDQLQPPDGESFISRLYRKLWERVGGRPWTWIIRDSWFANPLLWLFICVGVVIFHLFLGGFLVHVFDF
jgi:hypothetical protein